jgi:hypothetical protein
MTVAPMIARVHFITLTPNRGDTPDQDSGSAISQNNWTIQAAKDGH